MFQLRIEAVFSAAHAITIRGVRETLHGHDWRITAVVQAPTLDADGLVCDFHLVERNLRDIAARFHNRNLNDTAQFTDLNPTAEHVAMHLAKELARTLPSGVSLYALTVTEAPGCAATYLP